MRGLARPPKHSRRKLSVGLRAWPFRGGPPCWGRTPMCRRVRAADLDIDRTANVLVKEYGSEQAPLMAAKLAPSRRRAQMNYEFFDAISRLDMLELSYDGYVRCVEPHAYGRSDTGHDVLRCWQVSGGSDANDSVGWKLLSKLVGRGGKARPYSWLRELTCPRDSFRPIATLV